MKRTLTTLICIACLSIVGYTNNEDPVKESINKIAKELVEKYPGKSKVKVAILHFRTNSNELKPFNKYIQDELSIFFKGSRFEIIDQNALNCISESYGWNLDMSNDYKHYSALSEEIFRNLGMVPEAFIYGQINDNIESVTLTGYILPNGLKSSNIYSTQIIESSEVTDRLLSKPIRKPKQKTEPQVVIVEKPVYIEKEVVVEKPVYVEKEVIVEKPVYIERPTSHPREPKGPFTGKVGDKEIELLEIKVFADRVEATLTVVNHKSDDKIGCMDGRFIDPDGNEFSCNYVSNSFRERDLIEGVAIRGTFTFRGNNINQIMGVTVIEFNVYSQTSPNDQQGALRFRNVPIIK